MNFIHRGCNMMPRDRVVLKLHATVSLPVYTRNNKMYIDLDLENNTLDTVRKIHEESKKFFSKKNVMDCLEGTVLKVKIPFRYNQVTCKVHGQKTIQELVKGDHATFEIQYCGVWNVGEYCGTAWKLNVAET